MSSEMYKNLQIYVQSEEVPDSEWAITTWKNSIVSLTAIFALEELYLINSRVKQLTLMIC